MSTIASMAVELTADTGKFQKDIENSTEDIEGFEDSTESASSSLDGFMGVAKKAAAGLGALTGAIGETVRRTSNFAKEMEMMAGAADVSVESFQELNFAFSQMNLDTDDVSEALVEVNRVMGEAARGEVDMQRRLEDLGFTMNELSELGTEEAFIRMVDSLAEMESQAEKTAISGKLFGEDVSRRLLPAIEGGSEGLEEMRKEAEELGIVMDRDTIRRFSNFRDEFRATRASLFNGVRMLSAQFLPVMTRINDRVQGLAGMFANLDEETRQNVAQWTLLTGGVLAFITAAGLLAKTIQLVISGFIFLKVSIATILGLFSTLAMSVLLPIAAMGLLYTAWEEDWLGMRTITTETYKEHIKPSIDNIVNKLNELKDWFLQTELGQMISEFWTEITDIWTNEDTTFIEKLDQTLEAVRGFIADFIDEFMPEPVSDAIFTFWDELETIWADEESSFATKTAQTIDVAIDFVVAIGSWIWERTQEAYSNLGELIQAAWDYWAKDDEMAFENLEISLSDITIIGISFATALKGASVLKALGTALAAGTGLKLISAAALLKFSVLAALTVGLVVTFNYVSDNWDEITAKIKEMTSGPLNFAADPTGITGGLENLFPDWNFWEWSGGKIKSLFDWGGGKAEGGMIRGKGTGTSDSIMARLSDGEFVVNAKATEQFLPLLKAINSGRMPAFQNGGLVGRAGSAIGGLFADTGFQDQIGSIDEMINSVSEGFDDLLKGIKVVVEMIFDGVMLLAETVLGEERVKDIRKRFEEIKESATEAIDGLFEFGDGLADTGEDDGGSQEIVTLMDRIRNLSDTIIGFIPTWTELKEGVITGWDAIKSFFTNAETRAKVFDTSMGIITSGLKSIGGMMLSQGGGAGQGLTQMATGDVSGGIMSMLQQSDAFKSTMEEIGPVLAEIANIVGQVFAPILKALKPILEIVADVFRTVGIIVLSIAKGILNAWNFVAQGIEKFLNGIIGMINKIPFVDIAKVSLQIDTSNIEDSLEEIKKPSKETAKNTEEMAEAMRNVPQMLPTQMIRQDITAGDIPSAQVGAEVTRTGLVNVHAGETITPGGKENKGTVINIQGDVYGWNDFKRKVNQAFDQRETGNRLATQGSTGRGVR